MTEERTVELFLYCVGLDPTESASCAASATRMPSASASHRRVEPSTSVNKNVTTPEGAAAAGADTYAESHNGRLLPRTSAESGPGPTPRGDR